MPRHLVSDAPAHLESAAAAEAKVRLRRRTHNVVAGVYHAHMLLEPVQARITIGFAVEVNCVGFEGHWARFRMPC